MIQPIFDRRQLRHNHLRREKELPRHRALFEETATDLLERLSYIKRPFPRVLDLGSRETSLSEGLRQQDPARHIVRAGLLGDGLDCITDEEFLPFAAQSFDLIASNLALHWVNDVPGALIQARHALAPNGFFLAALLGGETLHELRACLYEAENELRGGMSPRVSPFMDLRDGAGLLQRAGFIEPVADREKLTFIYPDAFALMRELRGMGEANSATARDKRFTPRNLFLHAADIYAARHPASGGGIQATFEVLVLSGWTPNDKSQ